MRVFLANHQGPILLIAFTNHALDHLLRSVLRADITTKIVRLGSRSSDEEIGAFSLESLERFDPASDSDNRSVNRAYGEMRNVESELKEHLEQLHLGELSEETIVKYLELFHPDHIDEMKSPNPFVHLIRSREEGWTEVTRKGTQDSLYQYWARSEDLQWISKFQEVQKKQVPVVANRFALLNLEGDQHGNRPEESQVLIEDNHPILETEEQYGLRIFLKVAGLRSLPSVPNSNRPLTQLIQESKVWEMSPQERKRIVLFWKTGARDHFIEQHRDVFSDLKERFETAKQAYDEVRDQVS